MKKKPTKKKPPRSTLTASDYLLFDEMISRIRALEHLATESFMKGNVDRSKLAKALGKQVGRIQTIFLPAFGKCRPPYCNSGGVCEWCAVVAARQQVAQAIALWQRSNGTQA